MAILVQCKCGRVKLKDDLAGRKVRCKKCGLVLLVPKHRDKRAPCPPLTPENQRARVVGTLAAGTPGYPTPNNAAARADLSGKISCVRASQIASILIRLGASVLGEAKEVCVATFAQTFRL